MAAILVPQVSLILGGSELSGSEITRISVSLSLEGESDELSLDICDPEHKRLASPPAAKTAMSVSLGFAELVSLGAFELESVSFKGSDAGCVLSISAQAAGISKKLRTKRSQAYENVTLKSVAERIAARHGYKVSGLEDSPLSFKRLTQHRRSDLDYLSELARLYGYVFKIQDGVLVFYHFDALVSGSAVDTIRRTECNSWSISRGAKGSCKKAKAKCHDQRGKRTILAESEDSGGDDDGESGDDLEVRELCEDESQAESQAKSAHSRGKRGEIEGSITLPFGNPYLQPGSNITLSGFGAFDATYLINKAAHEFTRDSGYVTQIEFTSGGKSGGKSSQSTEQGGEPDLYKEETETSKTGDFNNSSGGMA